MSLPCPCIQHCGRSAQSWHCSTITVRAHRGSNMRTTKGTAVKGGKGGAQSVSSNTAFSMVMGSLWAPVPGSPGIWLEAWVLFGQGEAGSRLASKISRLAPGLPHQEISVINQRFCLDMHHPDYSQHFCRMQPMCKRSSDTNLVWESRSDSDNRRGWHTLRPQVCHRKFGLAVFWSPARTSGASAADQ